MKPKLKKPPTRHGWCCVFYQFELKMKTDWEKGKAWCPQSHSTTLLFWACENQNQEDLSPWSDAVVPTSFTNCL